MFRTCLFLMAMSASAQEFISRPLGLATDEQIRGAAKAGNRLYTWGKHLLEWELASGRKRTLISSKHGGFFEGGCMAAGGVVVQDGSPTGPLLLVRGTQVTTLDRQVEMHDCLAAKILGHEGILMIQAYGQVRFFEHTGGAWRYRELYSFYTASREAGLRLADVDHDGRTDIIAGNYWIRSPEKFDLPWRLFAINLYNEQPDSATLTLALDGRRLIASQGHVSVNGRIAAFEPPKDPTQLWTETRIDQGLNLRNPHALATGGPGLVVGENAGPGSRLFQLERDQLLQIGTTAGVHTAFVIGRRILTVGADTVTWWEPQPRK